MSKWKLIEEESAVHLQVVRRGTYHISQVPTSEVRSAGETWGKHSISLTTDWFVWACYVLSEVGMAHFETRDRYGSQMVWVKWYGMGHKSQTVGHTKWLYGPNLACGPWVRQICCRRSWKSCIHPSLLCNMDHDSVKTCRTNMLMHDLYAHFE